MDAVKKTLCIVICVYNNGNTLLDIVRRCLLQNCAKVLIVDDGSTDCNVKTLLYALPVTILHHEKNLGKGEALKSAINYLSAMPQIQWMLTLDADGQHFPEDVTSFLSAIRQTKERSVIFTGVRDLHSSKNIPSRSILGRKLSNSCIEWETGRKWKDTQSGFRCYPVAFIKDISCFSGRYDFETELLVRCAWKGASFLEIPIQVEYFTKETRVSHFHVWKDNFRIALLHLKLLREHFFRHPEKGKDQN